MNDGEPAGTMADDNAILEAITRNHAEVMGHIDAVDARIDESVNALAAITKTASIASWRGLANSKTAIDQIQTRLGRHETHIEALEVRP